MAPVKKRMFTQHHKLLNKPERRQKLVQEFYEVHHNQNRDISTAKDDHKKISYFSAFLKKHPWNEIPEGLDLGCRGGALTKHLKEHMAWSGVDIDRNAIELAHINGIPCLELDISVAIDFKDDSFDCIMMTEVLEHLPFPSISVKEVFRLTKKGGAFLGSVPLDYHFNRKIKLFQGKRLSGDPTHIHHFSFDELDALLKKYFDNVDYLPLRGTAARHPKLGLSYRHFVRDIAFCAWNPKKT